MRRVETFPRLTPRRFRSYAVLVERSGLLAHRRNLPLLITARTVDTDPNNLEFGTCCHNTKLLVKEFKKHSVPFEEP